MPLLRNGSSIRIKVQDGADKLGASQTSIVFSICRANDQVSWNGPSQKFQPKPYEARPSMEACGVDAYRTARDNGFPIRVACDEKSSTDHYGVVLID